MGWERSPQKKTNDTRENKQKRRAVSESSRSPQSSSHAGAGQQAGQAAGPSPHPGFATLLWGGAGGRAGSLTRGLLSGLVERPEEAPLMDLDLGTQVRSGAQAG